MKTTLCSLRVVQMEITIVLLKIAFSFRQIPGIIRHFSHSFLRL
jgi:hypothetical protein